MNPDIDLDAEELKYLAIQAISNEQPEQAILYLKRAIAKAPPDGQLLYLLAGEHARIGLYDRAAQGMEQALIVAPGLHSARLQLGLLYLCAARVEQASSTLSPLIAMDEGESLRHFALGLQHLMHDRFLACRAAMEQGMALNVENPALNTDMRRILDMLPDDDGDEDGDEDKDAAQAPGDGNLWLSAYRRDEGMH